MRGAAASARPVAAHAAGAVADGGEGHRRPLRRPDRARPLRLRRRGRGRRARPRGLRGRAARRPSREADPAADKAIAGRRSRPRPRRPSDDDQRRSPPPAGPSAPGSSAAPTRSSPKPTARGDAATAKRWLLLREYRTATRFTRPGAEGTLALDQLGRGTLTPKAATQAVKKDLLDAYQARLRELLADARRGIEQNLPARRAEAAAQAAGYFAILAPALRRGPRRARRGAGASRLRRAARGRDLAPARPGRARRSTGFTAAPFTPEEAARRAQQLLQFLALVPVEYGRGVKDTNVTRDFEITGGRRVPHRRRRRVRGPARPARQARPRPAPTRPPPTRSPSSASRSSSPTRTRRASPTPEQVEQVDGARPRPRSRPRCRRRGPRRPTSPTTT